MSDRYLTHDTMTLERTYRAAPARVFAAWADPTAKAQWFAGAEPDELSTATYELDFSIGGSETSKGTAPDGAVYTYVARYDDIVENTRIVYSNWMLRDDTRLSVSVASVEFHADGNGTRLVLTEHGIYLDGEDKPEFRAQGIGQQLDALGDLVDRPAP